MGDKPKKILDPLGQLTAGNPKGLSEDQLAKAFGTGQPTADDFRNLIKTLWSLRDAVKDLDFSTRQLADQIQNLIQEKRG